MENHCCKSVFRHILKQAITFVWIEYGRDAEVNLTFKADRNKSSSIQPLGNFLIAFWHAIELHRALPPPMIFLDFAEICAYAIASW